MSGDLYQGYTKEIDRDQVIAKFSKQFGHEPVRVMDAQTVWLAGPIGEQKTAPDVVTKDSSPASPGVTTQLSLSL